MALANPGFDAGLGVRKAVLGDEYVDGSFERSDGFSRPFQEFITEYCWGGIWTRPGLPRNVRSLITLSMLTALSKPAELAAHVRGALRNGCTPDEIFEALLQATVYCGVPAGVEAMRAAQQVIGEHSNKVSSAITVGAATADDDGQPGSPANR